MANRADESPDVAVRGGERVEPKALLAAGLVVLLGIAAVVVSYFVSSHAWLSSLLLNLGVAMFLAIPLFAVTSLLYRKIDVSSKKLEDDIAELRTETEYKIERLAAAYDSRATVLRWAEGDFAGDDSPSLGKIRTLLDSGAASGAGLIVPLLPRHFIFVELCVHGEKLLATALDASEIYAGRTKSPTLTRFQPIYVNQSASLNHFAAQIIECFVPAGLNVPDDAFNPAEFKSDLKSIIANVAKLYHHYIDDEPGGIRLVVNAGWVVSSEALLARTTYYYATYNTSTPHDYGWRPHLLEKNWVDGHEVNQALRWAYSLSLITARWAEGTIAYPDAIWHHSSRLTDRADSIGDT